MKIKTLLTLCNGCKKQNTGECKEAQKEGIKIYCENFELKDLNA